MSANAAKPMMDWKRLQRAPKDARRSPVRTYCCRTWLPRQGYPFLCSSGTQRSSGETPSTSPCDWVRINTVSLPSGGGHEWPRSLLRLAGARDLGPPQLCCQAVWIRASSSSQRKRTSRTFVSYFQLLRRTASRSWSTAAPCTPVQLTYMGSS